MAFQPTRQGLVAPLLPVWIVPIWIVAVWIFLALHAPAVADTSDPDSPPMRVHLAIAVDADDGSGDDTGDDDGSDRDGSVFATVIETVFDRMGQTPVISSMPRDAAMDAMASGQAAGSFGWQPSSERMVRFHFSDPVAVIPLVVFSDAFVALDPETPDDLSGRSLCLPTGMSPPDEIRRLIDQGAVRQQPANNLATCARLVYDGQTDFFVAGHQIGGAAIESIDMADEFHVATDNPIGLETLHLVTPRSNPDGRALIAAFDRALATLAAENRLDEMLAGGAFTAMPAR